MSPQYLHASTKKLPAPVLMQPRAQSNSSQCPKALLLITAMGGFFSQYLGLPHIDMRLEPLCVHRIASQLTRDSMVCNFELMAKGRFLPS